MEGRGREDERKNVSLGEEEIRGEEEKQGNCLLVLPCTGDDFTSAEGLASQYHLYTLRENFSEPSLYACWQ
eukprot:767953-Hanusia_phi.AAC.3